MAIDLVFIVGAPRSGTTWLQHLLGAHPLIATSQETDLFDEYVAPWRETWDAQLAGSRGARIKGLPAVLTEEAFDQVVLDAVGRVHREVLALKPGAAIVLEKVPAYSLHGPLIHRYFPQARFVHVIRDGRDVAASMIRASRGWGRNWAPANASGAARQWRQFVEAAQAIRGLTDRFREIRYERLRSDEGPALLAELYDFCGAESDLARSEMVYRAFDLESGSGGTSLVWGGEVIRRAVAPPPEPAGFSGEGGIGAWERELGPRERLAVEREAGRLLRDLGYTAGAGWTGAGHVERARDSLRVAFARHADRVRYGTAARLQR